MQRFLRTVVPVPAHNVVGTIVTYIFLSAGWWVFQAWFIYANIIWLLGEEARLVDEPAR